MWDQITKRLYVECQALDGQEHAFDLVPFAEVLQYQNEAEQRLRPAIDAACDQWARTGVWPTLSDNERYLLHLRLLFAWQIAQSLALPHRMLGVPVAVPHPWIDEPSALQWLLIEGWHGPGRLWWQLFLDTAIAAEKRALDRLQG